MKRDMPKRFLARFPVFLDCNFLFEGLSRDRIFIRSSFFGSTFGITALSALELRRCRWPSVPSRVNYRPLAACLCERVELC